MKNLINIEPLSDDEAIAVLKLPKFNGLVESREAIMPRPSLLDLDVRVSVHPAPDILG